MKKLPLLSCLICLLIPGSVALSQPFPSFMLDSTIVPGPSFNDAGYTSVAFGPDVGLVVWVENTPDGVLRAARIASDGTLLDTLPIDVREPSAAGFINMKPGVAWGGNRFLVVWTEVVDFSGHNYARCAIVHEDGTVAQRRMLQDYINDAQGTSAAVAFDGTNFLALWICYTRQHYMHPYAYFARVSPSGVVLDSPPGHMTPPDLLQQQDVDVCFYGDKYLAVSTVWSPSATGVWGSFILPDGTTPDSAGFLFNCSIGVDCPSVTHDRRNYIVAWYELHDRTRLARVSDSGKVIDSTGVLMDTFSSWESDVFSLGDTTVVVLISDSIGNHDSLTVMAMRVDTALRKLDSSPIAVSWTETGNTGGQGPGAPTLALCGDDWFAAWFQPYRFGDRRSNANVIYRRLSREGQPVDSAPRSASFGSNRQTRPKVASDGTDFLATWRDTRRSSAAEVTSSYVARFSANGIVLDSQAIPIPGSEGSYPIVAFGGGCYLIVWCNTDRILGVRIAPNGVLLDTLPILLNGTDKTASVPTVGAGDSVFLVAWKAQSDSNIHGTRVTASGSVLDTAPLLLQRNRSPNSYQPQVAFDGENFLVARNDRARTAAGRPAATRRGDAEAGRQADKPVWNGFSAVRVNSDGQIIDSNDIKVAEATSRDDVPQLAYGDGVYLVNDNRRYVSWRVSTSGDMLDSVPHPNSGRAQVCFDGANFLLLCQGDSTLGGMRISPEGVLLDASPYLLVNTHRTGFYTQDASVVANDADHIGAVFQDFEPNPWLNYRIRASAFPTLGIGSQRGVGHPTAFRVLPNPASRTTTLSFNIDQAGPVRVTAFDAAGRRCASLFSGQVKAGSQTLPLDTRRLANGVYFLRLEAEAAAHSTRLVISR